MAIVEIRDEKECVMICPNCASDDVFTSKERDIDEGVFWCADGCGEIEEVVTGQEFADREAWETEKMTEAQMDANSSFWPRSHHL